MSIEADVREVGRKIGALEIIFSAPLWPRREQLSESGADLFDAMVAEAKPYALAVVDERYDEALAMLGVWGRHLHRFMDLTLVNDSDAKVAEANRRLIGVFLHYADASTVDWAKVVKA